MYLGGLVSFIGIEEWILIGCLDLLLIFVGGGLKVYIFLEVK